MDNIISMLSGLYNEKSVLCNESMKNHTSFKIGGNADYMVIPESVQQICDTVSLLKGQGIKYTIIGNGSNLLVDDDGIRGVVIKIAKNFSKAVVDGNKINAYSGILLSRLANVSLENSLSGLEFSSGIPGTLGGAIIMNAGAYGGEMKDVVVKTRYINSNGDILTVSGEEHKFGYRTSVFTSRDVILEAEIILKHSDKQLIKEKMLELNARRKEKQPLDMPSAGSAFKRPEGHFAGKLIEDAGLKGYKIGGAMVSEKHCGFIVSDGTATCADVLALREYIKTQVYNKFSVELESEIRYIK